MCGLVFHSVVDRVELGSVGKVHCPVEKVLLNTPLTWTVLPVQMLYSTSWWIAVVGYHSRNHLNGELGKSKSASLGRTDTVRMKSD